MRAVSLFSGAGGLDLGLERAGIQPVLQAESDPWCLQVLERQWPDVERVTDVRQVGRVRDAERSRRCMPVYTRRWNAGPNSSGRIDLVYGGFPCQDVSVAGNRAGLGGARSGLWTEFHRVLRELRPRWCLVENVPGLLSSNRGHDFGTILSGLDELGYGVAWRILDARYFGVPQRRRRVFLVGCLGEPIRAAQVLAVCAGCSGHSQARGEEREGAATGFDGSVAGTLGGHHGNVRADQAWTGQLVTDVAIPLNARKGIGWPDVMNYVTGTLGASDLTGEANETSFLVANGMRASDGHHGHSSPRGDGGDNLIAQTVNASYAKTTASGGSHGSQAPVNVVTSTAGVRRLTPLECERLMGWPDDWTRWTADGREIPDSHRYRLCGNGVVSTVSEWIGHRLVAVDRMLA